MTASAPARTPTRVLVDEIELYGDPDRDREILANFLEHVAGDDARARHAAAILRGVGGGRDAIDDAGMLSEMRKLLDARPDLSVRRAAELVARRHATGDPKSAVERLRKKWRLIKLRGDQSVFSPRSSS